MIADPVTPARASYQRAVGRVRVTTKLGPSGGSGLNWLMQAGSSKLVFPRPAHDRLDAVLVNTAGGVTGGDSFSVGACAGAGTHLALTTQAAERIYRAAPGETGVIETALKVETGAELWWIPQETILFDGCALDRRLDVMLEAGARFVMLEPLVFGRAASGEDLRSCHLSDSVSIRRGDRPIYLDRLRLDGDLSAILRRPAVAGGVRAMASLVVVDKDATALLPALRACLPKSGGASMIAADVLVLRLLAMDSHALRQVLLPVLAAVTRDRLPKNWRL